MPLYVFIKDLIITSALNKEKKGKKLGKSKLEIKN